MRKIVTLAASAIAATLVLSTAPANACMGDCTVLNPPDVKIVKRQVRNDLICQTRRLSDKEWAWVKANRNGCWFATTTEGYQTPLFKSQSGSYCAAPHTNDWGYTEQTTGRHIVFHL